MEFYFPTEFGEQLAFLAASVSALIGLLMLFAPGVTLRLFALQSSRERNDGFVLIRSSLAGFYLGLGASALLLAQPLVYSAFAISFAFATFGVFLSILSDGGITVRKSILLVVNFAFTALPALYVTGMV